MTMTTDTYYRREQKCLSHASKPTTVFARPHSTIEFAGRTHLVVEVIDREWATVKAESPTYFDDEGWKPATAAEWRTALLAAEEAEAKRQAGEQARREGETYGPFS
jgi:hypothetical protein